MRWKLLRRRLSISAPRVTVRSHLPWPLRWAVIALMLGFSGALALWAFETGKNLAGLDRHAQEELQRLRVEVAQLREEREKALSIANTADSLLKTERTAQDRLAQQLKQVEAENLQLKNDLGFFERLLPAGEAGSVTIRGLQAEVAMPGRIRYQMLVMQPGKSVGELHGRYELMLTGVLDGRPWTQPAPEGARSIQLKQYLRLEGMLAYPEHVAVRALTVKVTDARGAVLATYSTKVSLE